jgi:hypothetical protein
MRRAGVRGLVVLAIAVGTVVLAACNGAGATTPPPDVSRSATSPSAGGTVYLMAGDASAADLYRVDLQTLGSKRLTKDARISSLAARAGLIVVSDARHGIDYIEQYANGHLTAIPGLGKRHGFTPDVSADGRTFSFVELGGHGQDINFSVKLYDAGSQLVSNVITSKTSLQLTAFGPNGTINVTRGQGANEELVQLWPKRKMLAPTPGAVMLVWGVGPYAAWSDGNSKTSLVDPATGKVLEVSGWSPLCWSPSGTDLLVTDGHRLGLISSPDLTRVHVLGNSPVGPVWGCGWTK